MEVSYAVINQIYNNKKANMKTIKAKNAVFYLFQNKITALSVLI